MKPNFSHQSSLYKPHWRVVNLNQIYSTIGASRGQSFNIKTSQTSHVNFQKALLNWAAKITVTGAHTKFTIAQVHQHIHRRIWCINLNNVATFLIPFHKLMTVRNIPTLGA
jgi:hypothetical protein